MNYYYGMTHPVPSWGLGLWHRFFCKNNMHAFDEVFSLGAANDQDHYLYCDACGLTVYISKIDEADTTKGDVHG